MKRTAAASAVMVGLAMPAFAGAPATNRWAGPYIGFHAGFGTGDTKFKCISDSDCSSADGTFRVEGMMIGGQAGYNWVLSNGLVTGIEADATFSDVDGDAIFGGKNVSSELSKMATVRGKLGTQLSPDMIAFATAGIAFGQFTDKFTPSLQLNEWTTTRTGWTAGLGIENAISDRVSLKAEYLFIDYGTSSHTWTEAMMLGATGTAKFDHAVHTFRLGLNFKLP